METATFMAEVPIADADSVPICEGSVLRDVGGGVTGVVVRIIRPGDMGTAFDAIGDLNIHIAPGCTRVTNRYSGWRHVPHDEQTYQQRLLSWQMCGYAHDSDLQQVSEDEGRAVDGIMALLPKDVVDRECGPWPDSLDSALTFLTAHLAKITRATKEETKGR